MGPASIHAEELGVRFLFDHYQRAVTPALARLRRRGTEAWGIQGMGFSIGPGEGVALIGPSGSGKTTVLRLIAGVLSPDAGRLSVNGRVGSLLSTEAGLLGLLTGRENASLLGVLAGMTRAQAEAALEEVKATTHLEDAFERPVLSYSEGMKARLGFAVADQTDPEVLVLDEVHEALDHEFRQIVAERAHRVLESGGIVMAAGHDHPLLETFCERALWLADGRIELDGPFDEVREAYLSFSASSAS
jgi:lipopolysaccharide transport system ATP-binding protein